MLLNRYSGLLAWAQLRRPVKQAWHAWRHAEQPPLTLVGLARKPGTRVQFILAHPGDDILCAGLLLALRETGAALALTYLTRGEGGESGGHPRERLGSIREREARAAAEIYGIARISFLGYIDPLPLSGWHPVPEYLPKKLSADIVRDIRSFTPDIIVTHGSTGEGGEPAHVMVHRYVRKAFREMRRAHQNTAIPVLTLNAQSPRHPFPHLLNADDACRLEIDVSRFQTQRLAALACHASQEAAFAELTRTATADSLVTSIATEAYGADL